MTVGRVWISVFGQIGGKDADDAVAQIVIGLVQALASCDHDYGPDLKHVEFVLKVSGAVWQTDKQGCGVAAVRSGMAKIDIYVPISVWRDRPSGEIAEHFSTELRAGFSLIVEKLKARKLAFQRERLRNDFEAAMSTFDKNFC